VITATGQARGKALEVRSLYSGEVVGILPRANAGEADRALEVAGHDTRRMAAMAAHERPAVLHHAADTIEADERRLAGTIAGAQGKHRVDGNATPIASILRICAEEAPRISGDLLPTDATPRIVSRPGFVTPKRAGMELSDHKLVIALGDGE